MEIKTKTKKTYHIVFTEEQLKGLFNNLTETFGYKQYFEKGMMDNKSPSDEIEELMIKIYKVLKK